MVAVESDNFVIYCMTEVWEGPQYGKLQFPRWQSVSEPQSSAKVGSDLGASIAFDFPGKPPP